MRQSVLYAAIAGIVLCVTFVLARRYANRSGARALLRHRARVDRFKLASRAHVRAELLDEGILEAARDHASETGTTETAALEKGAGVHRGDCPLFQRHRGFQVGYRVQRPS